MSKEEYLKIQTSFLKVNIHCEGCKKKVKRILQKIDGVYTIKIDSDLGKVTVSGSDVDAPTLVKKLRKNGKYAELWDSPKPNQEQSKDQLKSPQIDNGKGDNGTKPLKGGQNDQKGMGGGQIGQTPNLEQQMKALQDTMKLPQLTDFKMPMVPPLNNNNKGPSQKNVKFNLPEEDDLSDGEFDDEYGDDEEDYDDDEMDGDDDKEDSPLTKMKPVTGNGQMPNMMMNPQMMAMLENLGAGLGKNGKNGGPGGGGVGSMQIPVSDGKDGKKCGGGNGNNGQIQGGGKTGKEGGEEGKMGNNGGENKGNGGGQIGNLNNIDGGKKAGNGLSDGIQGLANMSNGFNGMGRGGVGQLGNMPMGQMGTHMQMSQAQAVHALPATTMGGGGGGYYGGTGPEAGNPFQQQQLAAMMMNQQRVNGNEGFQQMMYERPQPAMNYMPPNPYPYPYQYPPHGEPYAHAFSDSEENNSSCSVM